MIFNRFAVSALVLFLGATGLVSAKASGVPQGPPSRDYAQERGAWDAPPQEWQDIQRRGFHDGIEGARKDFGNHRQPDVNNREEYRYSNLPRELRAAYREGFRHGYDRGMDHLMGRPEQRGGEPERPIREPERGGRDMGREHGSEIQHRGFQDGMDGARKDYGNNRRPDVNNREEYLRPNIPYELQRDYREAFRHGYQQAMAELTGTHDRN